MEITQEIIKHAEKGGKFKFWNWHDAKDIACIATLAKIDFRDTDNVLFDVKDGRTYANIEIYKPTLYVKDAVSIMKQLIADGYEPDGDGDFDKEGEEIFSAAMWQFCGKQQPDRFDWSPEWLEEK